MYDVPRTRNVVPRSRITVPESIDDVPGSMFDVPDTRKSVSLFRYVVPEPRNSLSRATGRQN